MLSLLYDLTLEKDTCALGERLARQARLGDLYCLNGNLGVGKSVLARAFVRNLCGAQTEVPSPTFTLVQTYDAPGFEILHADLYRLNTADEIMEIGLEERFDDAVCLVEWPQKMGAIMPLNRLEITLTQGPQNARTAALVAHGPHWENRLGS